MSAWGMLSINSSILIRWMRRVCLRHGVFALVFLVFAIVSAVYSFNSEKILANDGLGMDGVTYANMVSHFREAYASHWSDGIVSRIFPSIIVYLSLTMLGQPLEAPQIIRAFMTLNSISMGAAGGLTYLVMRQFQLRREFISLGLFTLLISFSVSRWVAYYPVLTDAVALAEGAGLLAAYMGRRPFWVGVSATLLSVTWPSGFFCGLLLLVFPRRDHGENHLPPQLWERKAYWAAALVVAAVAFIYSIKIFIKYNWGYASHDVYQPVEMALPISYILMIGYLAIGLYILAVNAKPLQVMNFVSSISCVGLVVAVAMFLSYPMLRGILFNAAPLSSDYRSKIIEYLLTLGVASPGRFVIPHVVYFGPFLVFTIFYWSRIAKFCSRYGVGLLSVLGVGFVQSLDSESRHLVHILPLLVVLTMAALQNHYDGRKIPFVFIVVYIVFSFAFSRMWLAMGGNPVTSFDIYDPGARLFYMNIGPFVTGWDYTFQTAVVIFAAVLLFRTWFGCWAPWRALRLPETE